MNRTEEIASLKQLIAKTPDDPWAKPMLQQRLAELEKQRDVDELVELLELQRGYAAKAMKYANRAQRYALFALVCGIISLVCIVIRLVMTFWR